MSAKLRGFWTCVWVYKGTILKGWDLWVGALLAWLFARLAPKTDAGGLLSTVATVQLGVATALFGVVLAGLAVIVAFLHEDYVKLLASAGEGLEEDFFPFWFTGGLAVVSIVCDLVTIVLVSNEGIDVPVRLFLFCITWIFLWSLFAALNLIPFTAAHGINRALQMQLEDDKAKGR